MEMDKLNSARPGSREALKLRFGQNSALHHSSTAGGNNNKGRTSSTRTPKSAQLATLKAYESICVNSVMEDCADQLAILGSIMPGTYETRKDAPEMVQDEIANLVDEQKKLEGQYEEVMTDRRSDSAKHKMSKQTNRQAAQKAGKDLTNSTYVLSRNVKQNPLTSDNLAKIQEDRGFLENVIIRTIHELAERNTFHCLVDSVRSERLRKQKLQETIKKEEEGRRYIKNLKDQLVNVAKEKESELQSRMEMIAHLKDQLQELKAKTSMEKKFVKKECTVSVNQTQKKCNLSEKELRDEIDRIRRGLDEEVRCNAELTQYLTTHQVIQEGQVEYWMDKYEKDTEAKQHELDVLKTSKAKDLEKLQELTKLYAEYEQVVVEDRIEKEKVRRKEEQAAIELKAAIRIQSWFRGVMVRKGLGPFSKKKKKKGKGKKSGKKKKK